MKKILIVIILFISLISFSSCNLLEIKVEKVASDLKENTNLDYNLLDDLKNVELTETFGVIPGFGCRIIWNKDKYPTFDGEDYYTHMNNYPLTCYTITAWPDYSNGGSYITNIITSDDTIKIFNVNMNSSADDIKKNFEDNNYKVTINNNTDRQQIVCESSSIKIIFNQNLSSADCNTIVLQAEVTNKYGIVY